jgi:hypothetical protein
MHKIIRRRKRMFYIKQQLGIEKAIDRNGSKDQSEEKTVSISND